MQQFFYLPFAVHVEKAAIPQGVIPCQGFDNVLRVIRYRADVRVVASVNNENKFRRFHFNPEFRVHSVTLSTVLYSAYAAAASTGLRTRLFQRFSVISFTGNGLPSTGFLKKTTAAHLPVHSIYGYPLLSLYIRAFPPQKGHSDFSSFFVITDSSLSFPFKKMPPGRVGFPVFFRHDQWRNRAARSSYFLFPSLSRFRRVQTQQRPQRNPRNCFDLRRKSRARATASIKYSCHVSA